MRPLLLERMAELDGRARENPLIVEVGYQNIWKRIRTVARKAGIAENMHPHMLRHTAATVMLEQGENIRIIQTFLGHESIQTTARYAQVRDGRVKSAVGKL
ncbi:MAG: tyrosine-type recombinase/integrase [Nitrospirae bacterium]|nr:tyrosine-type recombinase/integrase [Nitrospirota bacterium]